MPTPPARRSRPAVAGDPRGGSDEARHDGDRLRRRPGRLQDRADPGQGRKDEQRPAAPRPPVQPAKASRRAASSLRRVSRAAGRSSRRLSRPRCGSSRSALARARGRRSGRPRPSGRGPALRGLPGRRPTSAVSMSAPGGFVLRIHHDQLFQQVFVVAQVEEGLSRSNTGAVVGGFGRRRLAPGRRCRCGGSGP